MIKKNFELREIPTCGESEDYLENCAISMLRALKEKCKGTSYCDEGCALVTEDGYCGLKIMVSGKRPCEYDFKDLDQKRQ